jgi:6-phosphofructokinase 2
MHTVTLTINPAMDTSMDVDHVIADRKLRCSAPVHEPGGGGINVARVLHTLGSQALAVFPAGGSTGDMLAGFLSSEGVTHRVVGITGWTRENVTILETSSNQQYQFIQPGPTLSAEEQAQCLEAVVGFQPVPDYIVVSGSLSPGVPEDFYARVARRGREIGSRVVVDSSGESLRLAAHEGVFLVKPNLSELESLVGRDLPLEHDQEAAALELLAQGSSEVIVVSLGAGGALVGTREATVRLRAPTVRIQSRVGAGDSMVAGIVHGLMRGDDIMDAARLGVAAGAAAVMTQGSQLCRRHDVEQLFAEMELHRAE